MKKVLFLILMLSFWITFSQAQTTVLAKWTFPTGTSTDEVPDQASANNTSKTIIADGGTSPIDFSKNGATTKAAQASGWDNGANTKCWQIEINSNGFENLTISSKLSTGGSNPGPRDFKVQYKLGSTGTWTDIDSGNFETANDWTTGALDGIELPGDCDGQISVFIRWIMTSDTANDGSIVVSTGICKIDDIIVNGDIATSINSDHPKTAYQVYPNPSSGNFTIITTKQTDKIEIYTLAGQKVYEWLKPADQVNIDISAFGKGIYILRYRNREIQKIIVK